MDRPCHKELQTEDPELWGRSDVLITTKLVWGGTCLNERGLSQKHIMEGMDASLKHLLLDYVDLLYCHRPESLTPNRKRGSCHDRFSPTKQGDGMGKEPPQVGRVENEYYSMYKRQGVVQSRRRQLLLFLSGYCSIPRQLYEPKTVGKPCIHSHSHEVTAAFQWRQTEPLYLYYQRSTSAGTQGRNYGTTELELFKLLKRGRRRGHVLIVSL